MLVAMDMAREMGFRRARKYASDPSVYVMYMQMDMKAEAEKLARVKAILDEMRSHLPWYKRIFA